MHQMVCLLIGLYCFIKKIIGFRNLICIHWLSWMVILLLALHCCISVAAVWSESIDLAGLRSNYVANDQLFSKQNVTLMHN